MGDWGKRRQTSEAHKVLITFLDFEQVKLAAARDSWEDEEVADSWDAEEEEEEVEVVVKKVVEVVKKAAVPAPKKAPVFEEPEESEQARKERMNRLIQESDLENAMALFGISKSEINVDEVLEITKKEGKRVVSTHVAVILMCFFVV